MLNTWNRIVTSLIAVVVCLVGLTSVSSGDVLFAESFDASIDTNIWYPYGSPSPIIYSGASALESYSLQANGDSSWQSGLATRETFTVVPGLKVTMKLLAHADGGSESSAWQNNMFYLSSSPLSSFHSSGEGTRIGPQVYFGGGADIPWIDFRDGEAEQVGVNRFDSRPYYGSWQEFAFFVNTDGSVTYTWNDVDVLTTDAGFLDVSGSIEARLVLSGRSYSTHMLMDDVEVDVVPEPATMSLLSLGGLVLLKRRKA